MGFLGIESGTNCFIIIFLFFLFTFFSFLNGGKETPAGGALGKKKFVDEVLVTDPPKLLEKFVDEVLVTGPPKFLMKSQFNPGTMPVRCILYILRRLSS